ncbi:hypothetical protein EsDP_00006760 [Epichloe bromicola]|uniref:Uncharacterized protein n=1 Tax=Epichloe bromicola TaxID=79588 RepID=A0ABQ0CYJ8_9HYPO
MSTIGSSKDIQPANTSFASTPYQHQPEPPSPNRQTTHRATCRSVKSIVAWLESSSNSQSCSPRGPVAEISHNLSSSSVSTYHQQTRHKQSTSAASDVEDYSLTYLKYKNYFTSAPLGRCLDQKDGSQGPRKWDTGDEADASHRAKRADKSSEVSHASLALATEPCFVQRNPDDVQAF